MALVASLLWGTAKLAVKYVVVPVAITMLTAVVADTLADRMRARTAALQSRQSQLDIDPALHPAP